MRKVLAKMSPMKYLLIILVVAFAVRIYRISEPPKYYFDEVYHAVTAKLYARNDPAGYEWWHPAPEPDTAIEWLHPPIAKLTQAVGIKIFGENALGWRVSSVLFSLGVISATYYLALQLFKVKRIAVVAALLVSIDGLLLAQARLAMNDIHVVFFIVLSLIAYAKFREEKKSLQQKKLLLLSGLFAGLATSTKWSGVFVIGIYGLDQVLLAIKTWKFPSAFDLFKFFIAWIFVPIVVYVLSFSQFWIQGHTVAQFVELHKQIWYYQTHLTATHPFQSAPLQWIFDIRPVWLYVDYSHQGMIGNIYNMGNPVIFYGGLLSLLWLFAKCVHRYRWESWFLFLSYLSVWVLWLFSPRIMFFYHYAPAVPFLCIGLAVILHEWMNSKKKALRIWAYSVLGLAIVWFAVFYPNLTGIPVPTQFAEKVYVAIPSWR